MFSAKVQKNNLDYNRYGFIVAKTIDKRATVRNRLKRVFRSVIEQQWLEKGKGYDVLFILHPQIKDIERMQLEEKINNIFAKLSL